MTTKNIIKKVYVTRRLPEEAMRLISAAADIALWTEDVSVKYYTPSVRLTEGV